MSKVILAPYNVVTKYFHKDEYEVIGYIDRDKVGENIFSYNDIPTNNDVIVCSPNYFKQIYNTLLHNKVEQSRISFYIDNLDMVVKDIFYATFLYGVGRGKLFFKEQKKHFYLSAFLKNRHKNQRIFLLGNGPSLKNIDFDLLKNEITFASNKIYLSYETTSWRPTYYLVEDDLVYTQNYNKIKQLKQSVKLFPEYALGWAPRINDGLYFKMHYEPDAKDFPQFNPDVSSGLFWGSTVIYTMIQWAIYLGSKEIYLLGVDFSFDVPTDQKGKQEIVSEGEVNHFHKDYRQVGEKWNKPNLDIQKESFLTAKAYVDAHGIKIVNVTEGSKLDVFEKVDFLTLFDGE